MPRPTKGPRLGGGPAHERLLLNNLATQLFAHRSIQTTEAKAKRVRPLAERMVTFAKRGDLHARRRVLRNITDKGVVHELFTEIAPLVADRQGGYTRITKTGFRKGDNAPMAVIELVLEPVTPKRSAVTTRQGGSRGGAVAAPPAETAAPATAPVAAEAEATSEEAVAEQQGTRSEAEVAETNVPGTEDAPVATDPVPPVDPDADAPPAS